MLAFYEIYPMPKRIVVINGHPDNRPERFCSSVVATYVDSAVKAGHDVRRIDVGKLSFPLLVRFEDFQVLPNAADIRKAQDDIGWAEHLVFIHPLWLGSAPSMLKGFLEQVACGGFGFDSGTAGNPARKLKGKTARIIVTMAMPAFAYRFVFGSFGVRAFARGILRVSGVWPVRKTYFGGVELSERRRMNFLANIGRLAAAGA
jgi:putative NADPH-quinone reductase